MSKIDPGCLMRSLENNKTDPAPSRIFYRLERLWLTPFVRFIIKFGVPILLIVIICFTYFSRTENTDVLKISWREFRENIRNRPEFLINLIKIDGVNHTMLNEVRNTMNVDLPVSSYDVDLRDLKSKVQLLKSVENAEVYIAENIIHVDISERIPVIFWRNSNGLEILDVNGISIGDVENRKKYSHLPLIAGQDANNYVKEALFIYENNDLFSNEIIGLVRVGGRRWDIILTEERKVMLPTQDIALVLKTVIALNKSYRLSSRNFSVLDFRNIDRMTIRRHKPFPETVEIKLNDVDKGEI
jgi:cell division protein FtsQ